MARLIWTPQALDDIEAICEFIARNSNNFAHLFANKIIEGIKISANAPNMNAFAERFIGSTRREAFD